MSRDRFEALAHLHLQQTGEPINRIEVLLQPDGFGVHGNFIRDVHDRTIRNSLSLTLGSQPK